jgi:hypothetical protein
MKNKKMHEKKKGTGTLSRGQKQGIEIVEGK